jgi:hypothetical protein
MKLIALTLITLSLASCASKKVVIPKKKSFRDLKMECVERFLGQGVDPIKAKEVCDWSFKRG